MTIIERIYGRVLGMYFKGCGLKVYGTLGLRYGVDIPRLKNKVCVKGFASLDRNVSLILTNSQNGSGNEYLIEFGNNVYINRNTHLDAVLSIKIGNEVMIGPNCYITDHDHDYHGFEPTTPIGRLPLNGKQTILGDNVWLGANVSVLKGVEIGENSIIGAGSVVTKNIPPNVIAVGNPCRVIKKR